MAFDAFLKIPSISGESRDENHRGWIEVSSFSWGMTAAQTHPRADAKPGRVDVNDLRIKKCADCATPILMLNLATHNTLNDVRLVMCRATKDKQQYMEYKLSDVVIKSITPTGDPSGSESLPEEEVCFGFSKIKVIYTETDQLTGNPKGDITFEYDVTQNVAR